MLPFLPETIESHRTRYQSALKAVFDCRYGIPRPRPGELRGHVFDCQDGMRLIVSRDRESDTDTYLHLSASFHPGSYLYSQLKKGKLIKDEFVRLVERRSRSISGDEGRFDLIGFSEEKGVPHWRRRELNV